MHDDRSHFLKWVRTLQDKHPTTKLPPNFPVKGPILSSNPIIKSDQTFMPLLSHDFVT